MSGSLTASLPSISANDAIGIEHEGYAIEGATWYTESLYESSAALVRHLAHRYGVEMPITEQVERVCHEGVDPRKAVAELMSRETRSE